VVNETRRKAIDSLMVDIDSRTNSGSDCKGVPVDVRLERSAT
jgi:hypothetical protein